MCRRFAFLLIMRLAAWPRLARREETWKTAEILILHHQLTVLNGGSRAAETATEPVHLGQYRVRRQARVGGLINEYRLVAYLG